MQINCFCGRRCSGLFQCGLMGHLLLIALAVVLSACASLPEEYEKTASYALADTSGSWLAQRATKLSGPHPGESGFYVLSNGSEALASRLLLTDRAEQSLDVQYYYILPDLVGKLFLGRVIGAADRGVRVRLLLDDIETKGYENLFAALGAHPNIEVRLANPFAHRKARGLDFVTDLDRVNHRMHNKSMTFDNAVTIFGGRNIATEYFGANQEFNYRDLDVYGIGPVAQAVSAEFDTYWNAAESIPVGAWVTPDGSAESRQNLKNQYDEALAETRGTPYAEALKEARAEVLLSGDGLELHWAPARVVYDLPYGEQTAEGIQGAEVLAGILLDAVNRAETELFVVSPYFVPGDTGVQRFKQLIDRGVRCVVITNSLASTDVAAVYGGYANYREALLKLGVELYEVMAYPLKSAKDKGLAAERRSLHAKTFTVDRELLFVGSLNWDPRSRGINTEMGALIESPDLASGLVESISAALPNDAWRLRLNSKDDIEWVARRNGVETVYDGPPQTDAISRAEAAAAGLKVVEEQL